MLTASLENFFVSVISCNMQTTIFCFKHETIMISIINIHLLDLVPINKKNCFFSNNSVNEDMNLYLKTSSRSQYISCFNATHIKQSRVGRCHYLDIHNAYCLIFCTLQQINKADTFSFPILIFTWYDNFQQCQFLKLSLVFLPSLC